MTDKLFAEHALSVVRMSLIRSFLRPDGQASAVLRLRKLYA